METSYEWLCYFHTLPNTQSSKHQLLDYIQPIHSNIGYAINDDFRSIYKEVYRYHKLCIYRIIRCLKTFMIRKKYLKLTSQNDQFLFRLKLRGNSISKTSSMLPKITRNLASTQTLISNTNISDLNLNLQLYCREKGRLYGFDLRELNQLPRPLINPYTNIRFNNFNSFLIDFRLRKCNNTLLQLQPEGEVIIYDLKLKINNLVSILESHCGFYVNINVLQRMAFDDLQSIFDDLSEKEIIASVLSVNIQSPANCEEIIDCFLYLAQYADRKQNNRCFAIAIELSYKEYDIANRNATHIRTHIPIIAEQFAGDFIYDTNSDSFWDQLDPVEPPVQLPLPIPNDDIDFENQMNLFLSQFYSQIPSPPQPTLLTTNVPSPPQPTVLTTNVPSESQPIVLTTNVPSESQVSNLLNLLADTDSDSDSDSNSNKRNNEIDENENEIENPAKKPKL